MRTVGDLTLPEVADLFSYWAKNPPVHVLVAAYMGIKPEERQAPKPRTPEEQNAQIQAFLGMFGGHMLVDESVTRALNFDVKGNNAGTGG